MGDTRLSAFVKWLEENGADLSRVEIRGPSDGEDGGNAVYARRDIATDERYAWIPHKLVISAAVCTDALGIGAETGLSGRQLLASFLVQQRSMETSSFWKPYIDILPASFHTPVEFSSDEVRLLRGTPMEHALADRVSRFRDEYEEAKRVLGDKVMDYEQFAWGLGVVSSRSFCKALMEGGEGGSDEVLLPLLDMFNHMPMRKVTWAANSTGVEFVTREELQIGSQVFNNYGPKSNEELLMGYGFCVPDNQFSYYHIRINYSQDPMAEDKRQILACAGIEDPDQFVRRDGLPANLMPMLRVMAMTPADVVCLQQFLADNAGCCVEDVLHNGLGVRIELRARNLLAHLLEIRQRRLLENNPRTKEESADNDKVSENARLALAYRNELGDILASTLSSLGAAIEELVQFACELGADSAAAHSLPVYVAPGGRALPPLSGDGEQKPRRLPLLDLCQEPATKRVRVDSVSATHQFAESVLLTPQAFAQDAGFAEAVEQVDIDDAILLVLFLIRAADSRQSPWHVLAKQLESFRHPLQLLHDQRSDDGPGSHDLARFADTLDELCEIHESLFPLLSTHFPDVFPAAAFSLRRFVWAAGIIDMFTVNVPYAQGSVEGVCLV
ncbi:hypothetical protein EV175_004564 [Coemansia sp. RSA 1933]|nr:hypothetical protein EV175_004564 [Coemansia sp. RSA 1933]